MVVAIGVQNCELQRSTIAESLKSLAHRDFVSNVGSELTYTSGKFSISLKGHIAASAGEEPRGWDLNNSLIEQITFSIGKRTVDISGLGMDLREVYRARTLDDLRDWTDFSERQDYRLTGTHCDDDFAGSRLGNHRLHGQGGDDRIVARGGHDIVRGGMGDDKIILNAEIATARGGAGSDIFLIKSASGDTSIRDFDSDHDKIVIRHALDELLENANGRDRGEFEFICDDDFQGNSTQVRIETRRSNGEFVSEIQASVMGEEYLIVRVHHQTALDYNDILL
jgi:hypothetical protein